MASTKSINLNKDLWDTVSKAVNSFSNVVTLEQDLYDLLTTLINTLNISGGAFYLPLEQINPENHWITINFSPDFKNQLLIGQGELFDYYSFLRSKNTAVYPPPNGFAASVPIHADGNMIGFMILEGEKVSEDTQQFLQKCLDYLGLRIHQLLLNVEIEKRKKEIAALKYIARTQSTGLSINDTQINMIQSIRSIFEADEALLIVLDKDNPNLAIKKRLGAKLDWISQVSLKLEKGLIWQCVYTKKVVETLDVTQNEFFNAEFDGAIGLMVQSMVCVPLLTNGQILGALALLNVPARQLNEYEIDLLSSMATALANTMFNMNMFLELKVSNADLEASRWELLHSRNTLRALFDSIPASMYIIDRKYSLLAINMSRANRVNIPPNKLVGRKCYEKLYQRNDPCPGCRVMETYNNARSTTRIHRDWIDDEQFIEWEIITYPILNEDDYPVQAILFEQDVTEKRHLEANLIQSEKLAAVGQLAAGVAHEINNPLAAIIANAQLLNREVSDDDIDTKDSLNLIEIAGTRASQVVKNLLGFARKEQYDFQNMDLNETIHNALSLVQHEINSRPIRIDLELEDNLPRLNGSKDHLQGVWINLVMNAIDAFEDQPGVIVINTQYVNEEFRVTISDNAKGIPEEKLTRIFEPFYTTKDAGKGTGLGLSLCHRTVKQHGGIITAESKIGKGTKFIVTLPSTPSFRT